jgi:Rps23 Pro-64 3,4-dihydroxylase Tpa1-like proline 4-hydroxylase
MVGALPDTGNEKRLIDFARLEARTDEFRSAYGAAVPWRHLVVDDFLSPSAARRAAGVFPPLGAVKSKLARWLEARTYDPRIEKADPIFAEIFEELFGPRFTAWLEDVTGVAGLSADRALVGAGLHQGGRGSYLHLHADHNTHPQDPSRYRRVNVLVYLNETWNAAWGGDLELWDRDAQSCRVRIEPKLNRCVIMEVDDTAFHGYGRLSVPANVTRKALATYYYAEQRASDQSDRPHSTILPKVAGEWALSHFAHGVRRFVLAHIVPPRAR